MAPAPITAQELAAWRDGTMTELGPFDFQDVLTVSRVFVAAVDDYQGKICDPPWAPALTDEEAAAFAKSQERLWDMLMGVKRGAA